MGENRDNIYQTCSTHASHPDPRLTCKPAQFFVGHYVYKAFPVKDHPRVKKEHMWVMVTEAKDSKTLSGVLSNDPVHCTDLKDGDTVEVLVSEIERML